MDTRNLEGMVFVDLKKAFDSVDHQIPSRKLESDGVLHRELAWFGFYLSNRFQYCRVNVSTRKLKIKALRFLKDHVLVYSFFCLC